MFKRSFKAASQNAFGGKDAKTLCKDILRKFPLATESAISDLFRGEVSIIRIAESKTVIYTVNGDPIFLDVDGRGDLYPTVYALWKVPTMMKVLQIFGPVSKFVLQGADLMLPGLAVEIEECPDFVHGEKLAICVAGNPFPIAVGSARLSKQEALAAGKRGKCLMVVHHYRDQLWESGKKSRPNLGFGEDEVASSLAPASSPAEGQQQEEEDSSARAIGAACIADEADERGGGAAAAAADDDADEDEDDAPSSAGPSKSTDPLAMSQDELLDYCFLSAAKTTDAASLPMLTSTFYTKMQQFSPSGARLDIKKTSYKQLSKFLKVYEKKKIIVCKEQRGQVNLISISHSHPAIADHNVGAIGGADTEGAAASATAAAAAQSSIQIQIVYKPSSQLLPIVGSSKETIFSESEVAEAVRKYAAAHELVQSDGRLKIDALLHDVLYRKVPVEQKQPEGALVDMQECVQRVLDKMHVYQQITAMGKTELRKGMLKNVLVVLEDRQGGRKHLTKVTNLEMFGLDPEACAKDFQKRFNAATTVTPLPGKHENAVELAVQGKCVDELLAYLKAAGIDSQHIETQDKTKKK